MYTLSRVSDGVGDSGSMSTLLWVKDDKVIYEQDGHPRLGVCVRVGSIYARTMDVQDWWQTSFITEIIEDTGDFVKFKTNNSVYEWRCHG